MRRRTYLRATGAALAAGLAGCNVDGGGGDTPTRTVTDTATDTPTAMETATEEPTPTEDPLSNVTKPSYLDILPKRHLKGTDNTSNAYFVRVDWEWYLANYVQPMRFGKAGSENWTLEANAGNLYEKPSPEYELIHAPIGTAIQQGKLIANIIPQFPNLGPELVQQCGFEMENESGSTDSSAEYVGPDAAVVEDVIAYAQPGITMYVGVDADSLKTALQDNEKNREDELPQTVFYAGSGIASDRQFVLSEAWERPVLIVETGDEEPGVIGPATGRVTDVGTTKSAFELESVKWCLSEFVSSAPVIVGQINGGRAKFTGTNYTSPPIRGLRSDEYDTVFVGFDTDRGLSATAQVAVSHTGGEVISEERLREVYGRGSSNDALASSRRPHVAELSAAWSP